MYKYFWTLCLLGLSATVLSNCTPAQSPAANTEWVIANQASDTLWVAARFALDSVIVPLANVSACRHRLAVDSTDKNGIGFFLRQHLTRLTVHQGKWYWVDSGTSALVISVYCNSSTEHEPQINRVTGVLTYRLPPHCTQSLVYTISRPGNPWPAKLPIIGLQLQQGTARRVVLPGQSLQQVFRLQPTGHEHDYSARYLCQLTIKSGLTINN